MNNFGYALRQIVRRPLFTGIVVVMLALGIGATTAIFSVFHDLVLRTLSVPEPERLVNLGAPGPGVKPGPMSCTLAGDCNQVFSYPMFRDLESRQTVFTGLAAHRDFDANLSADGQTLASTGLLVSGSYFAVLNLRAALGRLINTQDELQIGKSAVVVLSYDYWRTQLGADAAAIGRRLTVNGQPLTIIGVAPEGFGGTSVGLQPQIFVPLTMRWQMEPAVPRAHAEDRQAYFLYLFARLASGVSLEQARATLSPLYAAILDMEAPLQTSLSAQDVQRFRERPITVEPGAGGQSQISDFAGAPLALLLGLTMLVLLIVCANIANLLLARGAARAGEMAIRASIGATRRQLAALVVSEAGLLAILGGALSAPIALATLRAIVALAPQQQPPPAPVELSNQAMLFAAVATLSTMLAFGLLPAIRAALTDPGAAVKRTGGFFTGRGITRMRGALVTTQIGFSMVLLVLAGLFTQSLVNIARVDLGMNVDSLVTFRVSPRQNGYSAERAAELLDRIEEALRVQPGVQSVTTTGLPLVANSVWNSRISVDAPEGSTRLGASASRNEVGIGFFHTLSIPLLAGREFSESDASGARVAVVNERFVESLDLGPDVLGRRFGFDDGVADIEIVGIVSDAKYNAVKGEIPPQFFLPRSQNRGLGTLSFYVRAGMDPEALTSMIPRVVSAIDSALPVSDLMTMETQVQNNVFVDRLVTMLSASFAGLATLLAAIGLYGVLAYNVAQRTRELGLRLALGATPARLRGMVLRQVSRMTLVGGSVGLAVALGLGRVAEALLFGLSGHDPKIVLAAVAVLGAVVLAASYAPAHRASNVTPSAALRSE